MVPVVVRAVRRDPSIQGADQPQQLVVKEVTTVKNQRQVKKDESYKKSDSANSA